MQKVRYINPKGESVYFDIKPPFVLQTIQGVGEVGVNIQSQKSPYQDGSTFTNVKLEQRDIFMQVTLSSDNDRELFKMRQDIQKVFNPKLGEGQLIYETPNGIKMISVLPDGTPHFGNYTRGAIICQINLIAHNPLWTDVNPLPESQILSTYISKYQQTATKPYFESTITKDGVNISNNGTFDTSLLIKISGNNTKNVILTNATSGRTIEIVKPLPTGSTLVIDTSFGKYRKVKLVSSEGVESNGFSYLSFFTDFIQLEIGENTLKYESLEDMTISVEWHNNYIGL